MWLRFARVAGNVRAWSPRLASPRLASPRLASPRLASPRLASPRLASPRLAILLVLCCASLSGCDELGPEDFDDFDEEEDVEFRLTAIGPNVLATPSPNSIGGNETSAVGFPSTNRLFVSYNSSTGGTSCGWSWSTNGGNSFTSTDDNSTPLPNVNGSDGQPLTRCLSDTWSADVAWSAQSPAVAMVAVTLHGPLGTCGGAYRDVVMWTGAPNSFPAGPAGNRALLSNQLGSGGCTDGPTVEWDKTNKTAWVWWWNDDEIFLRPVGIASNGIISPGATINLTVTQKHAKMALRPAAGAGMSPTIWLAYPDYVGSQHERCDLDTNHMLKDVTWWLSRSEDGGGTWNHLLIDRDDKWPDCLSDTPLGGNRSIVSPVYDPWNDKVMLSYSRHMDDENGDFVGTRVVTKMWPDKFGNQNAFTTWIPICNPNVCPNPPPTGMSCLVNGAPPDGETYCHQYGPGVGVKTQGTRKFAAVFHDTRDSALPHPPVGNSTKVNKLESDVWGFSIRTGALAGPEYTMSRITPIADPKVPWPETSTTGNLWWGDYEDGVVGFGTRFHAIWGDDRDNLDGGITKLMGAAFNE
jgi:hypothetical protein